MKLETLTMETLTLPFSLHSNTYVFPPYLLSLMHVEYRSSAGFPIAASNAELLHMKCILLCKFLPRNRFLILMTFESRDTGMDCSSASSSLCKECIFFSFLKEIFDSVNFYYFISLLLGKMH